MENKGGRPHLDGQPAGRGEYTVTKCITITPEMAEYLKAIGGGNMSRGVRMMVEYHRSKESTID